MLAPLSFDASFDDRAFPAAADVPIPDAHPSLLTDLTDSLAGKPVIMLNVASR